MKIIYWYALLVLLDGCTAWNATHTTPQGKKKANQALAQELANMAVTDQIAAYVPQGKYKELSQTQWNAFKDSVFTIHQKRLEQIFRQHGFPGFDMLGKAGSNHFWLMVQHSDHNPAFQRKVLKKMATQVKKRNAAASNYGLLVDRVNLNTGKAQLYGTQVTYNTQIGQAYPKELADSLHVDERRKAIGLPPLVEYLNLMTQMHFEMNKEHYLKQGIKEPRLYQTVPVGR